jgi:transposase
METAKRGRRVTDINSEKVKVFINSLKSGAYIQTACTFAGIGESTVHRWLERGRKENARIESGEEALVDEQPYLELWESIEKARAEATLRNVTLIQTAAQNGTWQAAAWFLERTNPSLYGRRNYNEITGKDGGALDVNLSVEELDRKIAVLMGEVTDESGESTQSTE